MFCFAPWIGYTRNKAPLFCTKLNEESYLNGCEPGAGSVSSAAMLRVHRASLIQLSSLWTSCRGLEDTICSYSILMDSWSPLNIEPRSPSPQILHHPTFIKSPLLTDWRWNRLETVLYYLWLSSCSLWWYWGALSGIVWCKLWNECGMLFLIIAISKWN